VQVILQKGSYAREDLLRDIDDLISTQLRNQNTLAPEEGIHA